MFSGNLRLRSWLAAVLASSCIAAVLSAGQPEPPPAPPADHKGTDRSFLQRKPGEHPLMPALRWAQLALHDIEKIKDFSSVMIKRERIAGKLNPYQYAFVKVRHDPFSVYMYFLAPADAKGQEAIYFQGKNDGLMWAHGVGMQRKLFGTVSLRPTGPIAMNGQHYPITEMGMRNMIRRLIEIGEKDAKYGECEVKFFEGAKVNGRTCTCLQVVHPVQRRTFLFHVARIFVDDELNLPLRYEAYDWPKKPGDPPELIEEYTYVDVKLNNGFTDADFDPRNPSYDFPK